MKKIFASLCLAAMLAFTVPATADPAQCPLPDGCDYRVSITIDVLDGDGTAVSNTNFISPPTSFAGAFSAANADIAVLAAAWAKLFADSGDDQAAMFGTLGQ